MTADALPAGAPKTIDLMAALQASLRREDPVAASQVKPAGAPTPTDDIAFLRRLAKYDLDLSDDGRNMQRILPRIADELELLRSRQTRDEDGQRAKAVAQGAKRSAEYLAAARRFGEFSRYDLADAMSVTPTTATRWIEGFIARGLVRRVRCGDGLLTIFEALPAAPSTPQNEGSSQCLE